MPDPDSQPGNPAVPSGPAPQQAAPRRGTTIGLLFAPLRSTSFKLALLIGLASLYGVLALRYDGLPTLPLPAGLVNGGYLLAMSFVVAFLVAFLLRKAIKLALLVGVVAGGIAYLLGRLGVQPQDVGNLPNELEQAAKDAVAQAESGWARLRPLLPSGFGAFVGFWRGLRAGGR